MRKHVAMVAIAWTASVGAASGQDVKLPGWTPGPTVGRLEHRATINVPEGYFFLDKAATRKFLEDNQNIPDGDELASGLTNTALVVGVPMEGILSSVG